MEDHIQTILTFIIAAFLLFIFPVYMAYEKKDDVSYALAMRYTEDLVDEVRNKGYISKYMYEDYRAKLKATGNSYDIELKHEYNRYDPITNYYSKDETGKYTLVKTTTQEEKKEQEKVIKQNGINLGKLSTSSTQTAVDAYITSVYESQGIDKVEDTYQKSTEVFNTQNILSVLETEDKLLMHNNEYEYAYTMNQDDIFNVTIKNTNVTPATVIYNMITMNFLDDRSSRIYVNYGGAILATKWYNDIDYAKMKHDDVRIRKTVARYAQEKETHYPVVNASNQKVITTLTGDNILNSTKGYILECSINPEGITDLRQAGVTNVNLSTGYNIAFGASKVNSLNVSVGVNGICIIRTSSTGNQVLISYPLEIKEYINLKVEVKNESNIYKVILYIDDVKITESANMATLPIVEYIGGVYNNYYFEGYIKDIKTYEVE